jgi:hypothetical protein
VDDVRLEGGSIVMEDKSAKKRAELKSSAGL